MKRRGQLSIEYVMVISFSLFLISTLLVIAGTRNTSQAYQVTDAQIHKVGNRIVNAAEEVYYLGEDSKKTLKIYMPQGVSNVSVEGKELMFTTTAAGQINEMEFPSEVDLAGNVSSSSGIKYIVIQAQQNQVCVYEEGEPLCSVI